ncbi:META domain-containing protein [Deinococcus aestuarii]|uniref:META domain-containing protein n=1 Tax=Deinococcus aestuarii TaxID=2774531 RepID=UPI001C0DDF2D|nr:META domain-containing protein [Deinococcus aestuarii]
MNRHGLMLALAVQGAALAQSAVAEPFADGTWTLLRLTDARGTVTPQGGSAPTLTLAGTRFSTAGGAQVSGSTGCNRFTGRGVFTANTVRLGPLASTRRACAPEVSALEARFLNVLSEARGLSFSPNLLVLSTGRERLVFGNRVTAFEASRLFAEWRLVGAVGDTPPTLRLEPGGAVSGTTGCNLFRGTFTLGGDTLHFSPLATTRRACPSPELQRQETEYLRRLERVRRYRVSGNGLTLILEDGSEQTFQRPVNGG